MYNPWLKGLCLDQAFFAIGLLVATGWAELLPTLLPWSGLKDWVRLWNQMREIMI